jgi:hypothetical protein
MQTLEPQSPTNELRRLVSQRTRTLLLFLGFVGIALALLM